jgi:3-oxoacyl-[acyl-carrier protein] reductase
MASNTTRKLALITGATGGIGRATAIAFAKTGDFNLALHYNSANQEKREEIVSTIKDAAGTGNITVEFFQADLGDFSSIRSMHWSIVSHLGHPDVLYNNAGANAGVNAPASLADVPMDAFETTWRINTGSGILLTQLCLPHMEEQGWGRVIFCSSVAGFTGGIVGPHYASSKSALHGFVHWLAGNVAKKGITVNAVAPALIGGTVMMGDGEEVEQRAAQSKFSGWREALM